jgi:4-hydroxy-3-methylbut-2-enyl diphosphate reductase
VAAVPVNKVLLASPRGFCAGVEMAIKALAWMVRVFEPPVYCYHEIVHNRIVVEHFRRQGVVFVDDVGDVPEGAPVMLSAHGTAPQVVATARSRGGSVVNAACPLVQKVHHEVKTRAGKGYSIVYVGHEGHQEAVGTMAVAPDAVHRVESVDEIEALAEFNQPVAFLAQTTLAVDEWRAMLQAAQARWPDLWVPGNSDLCFATTNRQTALRAIAGRCDGLVVIGSANSSNTLALVRTARAAGCPWVERYNTAEEVPDGLEGTIGVIAGASAPESLVQAVVDKLAPVDGVEEVVAVAEDQYFPLPRELRNLLRQVAGAAALSGLAPVEAVAATEGAMFDGREVSAAASLGI